MLGKQKALGGGEDSAKRDNMRQDDLEKNHT